MTPAAPSAALVPHCVKMDRSMPAEVTRDTEDQRLAERLRDGDPAALRDVYARFGRVTFGFLLTTLGDRGAAEDVQQQVFLEVWRRADRFDPKRGKLLTWVMTIARSRAIDNLRRRVPEPVDHESAVTSAESPPGVDEIEALADRWRMRALLDRLPTAEAELLRLRFYAGFSQTEIAQREDLPLGTVKTRMVSGLRHLREMIDEESGT